MIKKVTGLLILISFLLVKSGSLYALTFNPHTTIVHSTDAQEEDVPDEDQKRGATVESLDEEYIVPLAAADFAQRLLKGYPLFAFPDTVKVYITLSNPPPDDRL